MPGTYGTALFRNHAMQGVFKAMEEDGLPIQVVEQLREMTDCKIEWMGNNVSLWQMYGILGGTTILLIAIYVLQNKCLKKKAR